MLESKSIVQVCAGRYHSLALSNLGLLYAWGNNDNGQCAQNNSETILVPKVVDVLSGSVVGQIACGEHHCIALTCMSYLYMCVVLH